MRVDRYLWSIRVFKSRSVSSEACKSNKVKRGEEPMKPAKEVRVGDIVKVRKGEIVLSLEVIAFPKSRVGAKVVMNYVKDKTPESEYQKLKKQNSAFHYTSKYKDGRPTKRDMREITGVFGEAATNWLDFFSEDAEDDEPGTSEWVESKTTDEEDPWSGWE